MTRMLWVRFFIYFIYTGCCDVDNSYGNGRWKMLMVSYWIWSNSFVQTIQNKISVNYRNFSKQQEKILSVFCNVRIEQVNIQNIFEIFLDICLEGDVQTINLRSTRMSRRIAFGIAIISNKSYKCFKQKKIFYFSDNFSLIKKVFSKQSKIHLLVFIFY